MVPSARDVDTTQRPFSAAANATASSSVVIGSPCLGDGWYRTAFGTRSGSWAPCRCSGSRRTRRCCHHPLHSGAQVVVIGRAEKGMQIRHRLDRKQLLDDRGDHRCARRQRPHHRVLRVAERRLGRDGHRCVVDMPARQPGCLIEAIRPAQQCDVGQAGGALPGHGVGRGQRHRLGDQVRRHLIAFVVQQRRCGAHLIAIRLLSPQAHHRGQWRVQRRQRHQRIAHHLVANIDRQPRHVQIEQVRGDMRPQSRAPRIIRIGSPERDDDLLHAIELSRHGYSVTSPASGDGFR